MENAEKLPERVLQSDLEKFPLETQMLYVSTGRRGLLTDEQVYRLDEEKKVTVESAPDPYYNQKVGTVIVGGVALPNTIHGEQYRSLPPSAQDMYLFSGFDPNAEDDLYTKRGYTPSITDLQRPPELVDEPELPGIEATLAECGARYGVFTEHSRIAMNIQAAIQDSPNWQYLAPDMKHAMQIIADKLARCLNGDFNYIDNWHDIVGYGKLIENRLLADEEACRQAHDDALI